MMGLFDTAKRFGGFEDESLRERGIRGTAKVLAARDTGMSAGGRGNRGDTDYAAGDTIYELRLLVTLPGAAPYEVEHRRQGGLDAGTECPVSVDPDDGSKLFLDGMGMGLEQAAGTLSQFTGQPVGADSESLIRAAEQLAQQYQMPPTPASQQDGS